MAFRLAAVFIKTTAASSLHCVEVHKAPNIFHRSKYIFVLNNLQFFLMEKVRSTNLF
jgi:hypothetical protein